MASPRNQHCANCIGTLSFPIKTSRHRQNRRAYDSKRRALKIKIIGRTPLDSADSASQVFCRPVAWPGHGTWRTKTTFLPTPAHLCNQFWPCRLATVLNS